MKAIVCLVLLIGICPVRGSPESDLLDDVQSSADHVNSLLISERLLSPFHHHPQNRMKRQVVYGSEEALLDESMLCSLTCAVQMRRGTQRVQQLRDSFGVGMDGGGSMGPDADKLALLTSACDAVRPSVQCFDRCPHSELKVKVRSVLEPIRYICIERFEDIKSNARCLRKVVPITNETCVPRCRTYESSVTRMRQLTDRPYLRYLYSVDDLRDMLSGTCRYIQCHLDCGEPITRRICGETAASLGREMIKKFMASVQNFSSVSPVLPSACRRLAADDGQSDSGESEERTTMRWQSDVDDDTLDIGDGRSVWRSI